MGNICFRQQKSQALLSLHIAGDLQFECTKADGSIWEIKRVLVLSGAHVEHHCFSAHSRTSRKSASKRFEMMLQILENFDTAENRSHHHREWAVWSLGYPLKKLGFFHCLQVCPYSRYEWVNELNHLQILRGSFSAVSTPIFRSACSLKSSWRDLQDLHTYVPFRTQHFSKNAPFQLICLLTQNDLLNHFLKRRLPISWSFLGNFPISGTQLPLRCTGWP